MKKLLLICCCFLHHSANAQTLDSAVIHNMEAAIENGTYPNTHSLLIAHNNEIIYEKYWTGKDRTEGYNQAVIKHGKDSLHQLQSVTKSIVSACVGIALQQGKIKSIDQKVFDFFPEYSTQDTGLKAALTIRDLLTMTTGLTWNEENYNKTGNSEHLMDSASDPVGYVLSLPMSSKTGETFTYCGGAPQVLAAIIEKTTGKRIDVFAKEYLFAPLGITNYEWTTCTNSNAIDAFDGIYFRSRDMMAFGLMYLNNGKWNGKQIIPASWVKESTTPQTNTHDTYNDQYGFLWWLWKDSVLNKAISIAACLGNGGQCIFIDKENNLVVVVTAGNYRMKTYSYELFKDFVYAALFKNKSLK
jgi:CubicO group peptidase (beta-lactamase class C family)